MAYRVRDITGKLDGEYALKRVQNGKRYDRFAREIEAINRLNHEVTRKAAATINVRFQG
jgi:hypothetical protein